MSGTLAIEGGEPVREERLVFGQPYIEPEAIEEVARTLRSGWTGTGPRAQEFEERIREYTGAEHAVAVSSCSAALLLGLRACGVGRRTRVSLKRESL